MRKTNLFKVLFAAAIILAATFAGCKKADPPTVNFIANVDGYAVTFTVEATGTDSYAWDYGDGTTGTATGSHTYTYAESGDYTVVLTVTGEGGDATKTVVVSVLPSIHELLTGGPSATSGKSWKLSTTATLLKDGASNIAPPNYSDWIMPFGDNILNEAILGLGAEYDNVYTFKNDGSYDVDLVNGEVLAGWLYALTYMPAGITVTNNYGIFQAAYTVPAGMGFSVMEGDITMDIVTETTSDPVLADGVTDPGVDYIKFTGDGFVGIRDFQDFAIIREIDQDRMVLTVFMHSNEPNAGRPSTAITVSFDAQ